MPVKITKKDGTTTKGAGAHHHGHARKHAVEIGAGEEQEMQTAPRVQTDLSRMGEAATRGEVPGQAAPGHRGLVQPSGERLAGATAPTAMGTPAPVVHDIAAQRSFTLYKKDSQLIRDVQVHFLQNGSHVTESQVVRIALRALEISEKLQDLHTQIKSEDGRKHRQSAPKAA